MTFGFVFNPDMSVHQVIPKIAACRLKTRYKTDGHAGLVRTNSIYPCITSSVDTSSVYRRRDNLLELLLCEFWIIQDRHRHNEREDIMFVS